MPELPEVEHIRRTLAAALTGASVSDVQLARLDVVVDAAGVSFTRRRRSLKASLLAGSIITELRRHGKQLALLSDRGPVVVVQLGMSGQVTFHPRGRHLPRQDHVHCIWTVQRRIPSVDCRLAVEEAGRLVFRDPRRFGGLTVLASPDELLARWDQLGPDALTITPAQLAEQLNDSQRPIKAALLDQTVIAGVGNIYADESLFLAAIEPRTACRDLTALSIVRLAAAIRLTLAQAIESGGSTVRDYLNASGEPGRYAERLLVYGRGGETCRRCGAALVSLQVAQRTTVMCPRCQQGHPGGNDEEKKQFSSSSELGPAEMWIRPVIITNPLAGKPLE